MSDDTQVVQHIAEKACPSTVKTITVQADPMHVDATLLYQAVKPGCDVMGMKLQVDISRMAERSNTTHICTLNQIEEISLDALTFDILRTAVNLSRNEQISRLPALRTRLAAIYPGKKEQCEAAISTWAEYVRKTHPKGAPRFD